jgi:hypothetical protein
MVRHRPGVGAVTLRTPHGQLLCLPNPEQRGLP